MPEQTTAGANDTSLALIQNQQERTALSRMLERTCQLLVDLGVEGDLPPDIQEWWARRQRIDPARNAKGTRSLRDAMVQLLDTLTLRSQENVVKYGGMRPIIDQQSDIEAAYAELDGRVQDETQEDIKGLRRLISVVIQLNSQNVPPQVVRGIVAHTNAILAATLRTN